MIQLFITIIFTSIIVFIFLYLVYIKITTPYANINRICEKIDKIMNNIYDDLIPTIKKSFEEILLVSQKIGKEKNIIQNISTCANEFMSKSMMSMANLYVCRYIKNNKYHISVSTPANIKERGKIEGLINSPLKITSFQFDIFLNNKFGRDLIGGCGEYYLDITKKDIFENFLSDIETTETFQDGTPMIPNKNK